MLYTYSIGAQGAEKTGPSEKLERGAQNSPAAVELTRTTARAGARPTLAITRMISIEIERYLNVRIP